MGPTPAFAAAAVLWAACVADAAHANHNPIANAASARTANPAAPPAARAGMAPHEPCLSRRRVALGPALAALCAAAGPAPAPFRAPPAPAAPPERLVRFRFDAAGGGDEGALGEVTVRLEPEANPEAVALFSDYCAGRVRAPCDDDVAKGAVLERERLEKIKALQACVAGEAEPLTYDGSTVWRVRTGERIDGGAFPSRFNLRKTPPVVGDNLGGHLAHDGPGVVSMRRGDAGNGAFVITPAPAPALDRDYVIVGKVVEGLDVVRKLDALPTIRSGKGVGYQALAGDIAGRSRPTKGCRYGSKELYCSDGKPLKKVTIRTVSVL